MNSKDGEKMKQTSMWKNIVREIKQSFGRFVAIFAIVALGVALFSGLKITKSTMVRTTEQYFQETNFFDYRLLSTLGFEQQEVELLRESKEIEAVAGAFTYDIVYKNEEGSDGVLRAHSITENINEIRIVSGRLPETADECVVDADLFQEKAIGQKLLLSDSNDEEDLEHFTQREYTIVGLVQSPYYIQYERGNSSLGTGRVSGFLYLLPESFQETIYTEIFVKFQEDFPLYGEEYKEFLKQKELEWEELTQQAANQRYDRIYSEADIKLADAKNELEDKKKEGQEELDKAYVELEDARITLEDGEQKLKEGKKELEDGKLELNENEKTLIEAKEEFYTSEQELKKAEADLVEGLSQWQKNCNEMNQMQQLLATGEAELAAKKQELTVLEPTLSQTPQGQAMLVQARAEIAAAEGELQSKKELLQNGKRSLDAAYMQLQEHEKQLETAKKQLENARQEIEDGEKKLAEGKEELQKGEIELQESEVEYQDGVKEYQEGLTDYQEAKLEFEDKIKEAQEELDKAQEDLADLEKPEIYVLGRDTNVGYVCFENDSSIVEGIANVFPIFFFLVAALVCMTTMNRMVEEQRTQIGVLKALGYSNGRIIFKYILYSGLAATMGALFGYFFGIWLFPTVLWTVYGIMYRVDDLIYVFDVGLATISMIVALLCSVGTTWLSCRMELNEVAAQLMRPKSPKAGKRVMFEHIPFLWNRLSFLKKVAIRNILRYKKRFFMMILGIGGCTALIVTGFGIKDSIANIGQHQFEEVQINDISITLVDPVITIEELDFLKQPEIEEALLLMESTRDLVTNSRTKSVNMLVIEDKQAISDFIHLHTEKKEEITYPKEGEVVLTNKLADELGIKIGDSIILRNDNLESMELIVSGISENFIYDYVYINQETYVEQMGINPEYKSIYINCSENADVHQLSASLMKQKQVTSVMINKDTMDRVTGMLNSLDLIVIVVIISAAGLAFVVLYNLTNINITERIREIATIKVLGFYRRETANYVFRENLILTLFGSLVGLLMGKALHLFVMSQVKVDMIAFDVRVLPTSYLLSIGLTFLFTILINLAMEKKLDHISMTESLKSVD